MSRHRYPAAALARDYLRAAAGFILGVMLIALAQPIPIVQYVLGTIAALFALFGIRTLVRQMSHVEVTDAGIRTAGPLGGAIAWDELESVELRYYSTRRDRRGGWLQLKLRGGGRRLAYDSSLGDFVALARRAAREAQSRGRAIAPETLDNLAAIGAGDALGGER